MNPLGKCRWCDAPMYSIHAVEAHGRLHHPVEYQLALDFGKVLCEAGISVVDA